MLNSSRKEVGQNGQLKKTPKQIWFEDYVFIK